MQKKNIIDGSSIIDMEIMNEQEDLDSTPWKGIEEDRFDKVVNDEYISTNSGTDNNFSQHENRFQSQHSASNPSYSEQVASNVTSLVLETGRQHAKKAFSLYGNIDILRPYFDVELNDVFSRLVQSLVIYYPGTTQKRVPAELYGPVMLVFTLIAFLLFQMKVSSHSVAEGTLMGSAFAVTFGYWIGMSSTMWLLAYICNTHLKLLQIVSVIGYALFSHCIVLFLTTIFHNHKLFYVFWVFVGGLAALRLVCIFMERTSGQTRQLIVCSTIAISHMLFILYTHFAYHQTVSELSVVFDQRLQPAIKPITKNLVISDLQPVRVSSVPVHLPRDESLPLKASAVHLPRENADKKLEKVLPGQNKQLVKSNIPENSLTKHKSLTSGKR